MGCLARLLAVVAVLGIVGAIVAPPLKKRFEDRKRPDFKTDKVTRGTVENFVLATGKIKPIETIKIGSFVSGPIRDMPKEIDFNAKVKEGDMLCRVDPALIQAQADSAEASLKIRKGDVARTKAQLELARNDERRAVELREKKRDFVSQAEMDQLKFNRMQLEASLTVAEASVEQAQAQVDVANTNLGYTVIRAPKDGVIIDRKIEPGQTLAAQFQTPELFEIGVELDKRVHIYASVDESEIGFIQHAEEKEQPVTFTVNAHRDEVFEGRIIQIRLSATETQSVVTYPVIVEADNRRRKLLPNMTADLSFKIEEKNDVLRIPNQALLYLPKKELVRKEDRKIVDGSSWEDEKDEEEADGFGEDEDDDDIVDGGEESGIEKPTKTARERARSARNRNRKHIWVKDGDKLRAVQIEIGLSDQGEDGRTTEVVKGDLEEGQEVVVGEKPKKFRLFGGGGGDDD